MPNSKNRKKRIAEAQRRVERAKRKFQRIDEEKENPELATPKREKTEPIQKPAVTPISPSVAHAVKKRYNRPPLHREEEQGHATALEALEECSNEVSEPKVNSGWLDFGLSTVYNGIVQVSKMPV